MNQVVEAKPSEYKVYKQLKWQEERNPKNKYDNRLYFTMRYKTRYEGLRGEELFKKNYNRESIQRLHYSTNSYWYRRYILQKDTMYWGSNKFGDKKFYKIRKYHEVTLNYKFSFLLIAGINFGFLAMALYYKKLEHDIWMFSYGDYMPRYEKLGIFKVKTFVRKIPYYLHSWKLVSAYNMRKYDISTVNFPTGYQNVLAMEYLCRQNEYKRRRDKTFDFMQIGENDFYDYTDQLP